MKEITEGVILAVMLIGLLTLSVITLKELVKQEKRGK